MFIEKIDEEFSVTGQVQLEDLEKIKAEGYQIVICNRPDDEEVNQPDFTTIKNQLNTLGIEAHYLPIASPADLEAANQGLTNIRKAAPVKTLMYCRSGGRSLNLYRYHKGML